jgi:hypothetical protein
LRMRSPDFVTGTLGGIATLAVCHPCGRVAAARNAQTPPAAT